MTAISRRRAALGAAVVGAVAVCLLLLPSGRAAEGDRAPPWAGAAQVGEHTGPSRTVSITYSARMNVPPGARDARLYMPLPVSDEHQQVLELRVGAGTDYRVFQEPIYGNRLLCARRTDGTGGPLTAVATAVVRRVAYRVGPAGRASAGPVGAADQSLYLGPAALIPLEGPVEREARAAVTDDMSEAEKARAMYDYLARTLSYDKTVPGYGRGDAVRACDVRKGNCTDFHSLFIGMARVQGIPARFLMGFLLPRDQQEGSVAGYHCWAEFYLENVGWVPVDISEASQDPSRHEELFAGLDADRIHFTTGRDLRFGAELGLPPLNYFIYPLGVLDGRQVDDVAWEFRFEDTEA